MSKQIFQSFGFSKITLIILAAVVVSAGILGGMVYMQKIQPSLSQLPSSQPSSTSTIQPQTHQFPSTPIELVATKRLIKSEDIVLEKVDVIPQIPEYNLPIQTKDISNYQEFSQKIQLSSKALSLVKENGFAVIPTPEEIKKSPDDFSEVYSILKDKDIPIFITADSLLHYYHIFFDTTLMKLERDLFYNDVWEMSEELLEESIKQYNESSGDLKEAAKRNVAYLSVAMESLRPKKDQLLTEERIKEEYGFSGLSMENLISMYGGKVSFKYFSQTDSEKYSFEIPDFVEPEVQRELELIEAHSGWASSQIFIYGEDYSQYVPRGHYTKSEKLKNYFKAMMWYGRMTNLVKGSSQLSEGQSGCLDDGIVSVYDAKIQTLQSSLIAKKFSESKAIKQKWQRMYAITSFFVGFSDDIGPYEYSTVLESLFKEGVTAEKIEAQCSDVQDALLSLPLDPKIYSGLGQCELRPPFSSEQAERFLKNTKGFRFMGQRFVVDSYLFSKIVSPYSGEYTGDRIPRPFTHVLSPIGREVRGFPRGLDIMALFGSKRAKEILRDSGDTEYSNFDEKFSELKTEIDSLPAGDWFENIYWNWLYTLRALLDEPGQGNQTFMQTEAWQDKELSTALASWAELRHDTILYVKQSYTMAEMGAIPEPPPIVGYVEPVPEFYARLLTLTKMTNQGLKNLVPQKELEELKIEQALDSFSEIISRLLEISKKELENKLLSDKEYRFIEDFGVISEELIGIVSGGEVDPDIFKTVLVADVHTDGNTEQVLEEGVGYIKTLVVAYKLPDGHILLGAGPVFSYYEFKQPMNSRLTDEAWRKMLDTEPPSEQEWIKSFSE